MELRKIRRVIELAEETGLVELEVHSRRGTGDDRVEERVRVVRAMPHAVGTAPTTSETQASAVPKPRTEAVGNVVPAPMAGTFYRAPAPGEKAFVEVGDTVAVGDVLCIIESMKMMNRIESNYAGQVAAVLLADGVPIETGAALFRIV